MRICYVGAGGFSNAFIYPQLHRHGVELAAVCDLDIAKAHQAAGKWGFRRVYTDFERMCEVEQPDALFCVGPPAMQHAVGLRLLEYGLPVYVQKPAAPTAAQVREMAEVAERTGALCHVGFNLRSAPSALRVREIIASEEFGGPTLMVFRYGLMANPVWHKAIADQHIHAIDLIVYLLGDWKSVAVVPLFDNSARGYVAAIAMASGVPVALCTASEQDAGFEFLYYEITGHGGQQLYSHDGDLLYHRREGDDLCLSMGSWNPQRLIDWWGYFEDVRNFLAAARGEEADRCPVGGTVRAMELGEEIARQCYAAGIDDGSECCAAARHPR